MPSWALTSGTCAPSRTRSSEAGRDALKAIEDVEGVVTPFDICSAASRPETSYPWIGTNNQPTPTVPALGEAFGDESRALRGGLTYLR